MLKRKGKVIVAGESRSSQVSDLLSFLRPVHRYKLPVNVLGPELGGPVSFSANRQVRKRQRGDHWR